LVNLTRQPHAESLSQSNMFSSALIIFREIFEIVLIVGVVLAATRGIPHRQKAIAIGFGAGILGSITIAIFMDKISALAEGVGQEIFNASVLFVAAAFIGWTIIWMKKNARNMSADFEKTGAEISQGNAPFISLSAIIALAIFREGSEIVLFTYGMLAAGQSAYDLAVGSVIGLIGGCAVGGALYAGLIRISTKHFFAITSGLLMLLVAGMASQGMGLLVAAGMFENLSGTAWNSEWLLSGRGFLGQSLSALIGYTARPSFIQVIVYALTLGGLIVFTKISARKAISAIAIAFLTLMPTHAFATKKVYNPYVEKGEVEIEYRGGYDFDDNDDADGAWKQKLAIGYGFTDYWFSEIYGEVEKGGESGTDIEFTAVEWENKFQLTGQGEYWLDVGLLTEIKISTDGGEDKAEAKLLLAKDWGDFTHLLNLAVERELNNGTSTEFGTSWGSRYRYNKFFEPGFEFHSGFGDFDNSFNEEDHRLGPVIYGQIGAVKYDIGYLFGLSNGAPDGTLKVLFEYEFRF